LGKQAFQGKEARVERAHVVLLDQKQDTLFRSK
jgi:hypothetical protein